MWPQCLLWVCFFSSYAQKGDFGEHLAMSPTQAQRLELWKELHGMTHSKGGKTEFEGAHPELLYIAKCESYLWHSAQSPVALFADLAFITFYMEDLQRVWSVTK